MLNYKLSLRYGFLTAIYRAFGKRHYNCHLFKLIVNAKHLTENLLNRFAIRIS